MVPATRSRAARFVSSTTPSPHSASMPPHRADWNISRAGILTVPRNPGVEARASERSERAMPRAGRHVSTDPWPCPGTGPAWYCAAWQTGWRDSCRCRSLCARRCPLERQRRLSLQRRRGWLEEHEDLSSAVERERLEACAMVRRRATSALRPAATVASVSEKGSGMRASSPSVGRAASAPIRATVPASSWAVAGGDPYERRPLLTGAGRGGVYRVAQGTEPKPPGAVP